MFRSGAGSASCRFRSRRCAVIRKAVEERRGHLCVAERGRPFGEGEVRRHDDRRALVEPVDQVVTLPLISPGWAGEATHTAADRPAAAVKVGTSVAANAAGV